MNITSPHGLSVPTYDAPAILLRRFLSAGQTEKPAFVCQRGNSRCRAWRNIINYVWGIRIQDMYVSRSISTALDFRVWRRWRSIRSEGEASPGKDTYRKRGSGADRCGGSNADLGDGRGGNRVGRVVRGLG